MNHLIIIKEEFYELMKISTPAIISNTLECSFWLIDMIMLGHLGKGHLAAAAIGNTIINILWAFMEGVMTAQDTLASRAFGSKEFNAIRYWSAVSLFITIILCIIATIILLLSPFIINSIYMVTPHLGTKASIHIMISIPGFWALALFRVQQKYLQTQNKFNPSMYCSGIGNIVNIIGNYFFMYLFGIGFAGCAMATSLARIIMCLCMYFYIFKIEENDNLIVSLTEITKDKKISIFLSYIHEKYRFIKEKIDIIYARLRDRDIVKNLKNNDDLEDIGLLNNSYDNDYTSDNDKDNNGASKMPSDMLERDIDRQIRDYGIEMVNKNNIHNNELDSIPMDKIKKKELNIKKKKDKKNKKNINLNENNSVFNYLIAILKNNSNIDKDNLNNNDNNNNSINNRSIIFGSIRYLLIGIPGGLMLGLDSWVFDVGAVFVAHTGAVSMDVHQILFSISSMVYLSIPFAISTATTVRIGYHLGKKDKLKANIVSKLALVSGFLSMWLSSYIVYAMTTSLCHIFTNDIDITYRIMKISYLVAGFQLAYGLHGCAQGVLRATGRQSQLALLSLISLWFVGLPTSLYLTFISRPTFGLAGFWIGLCTGMGLLALVLVVIVLFIDWDYEIRKSLYKGRIEKNSNLVEIIAYPRPGSLAVGNLPLFSSLNYNEFDEFENIEVTRDIDRHI